MNYEDEKIPNDNVFEKLASEFKQKIENPQHLQDSELNVTQEQINQKIKHLVFLLSENEMYLEYLDSFLKKNARYKITAQQLNLQDALEKTRNHKNKLLSLNTNYQTDEKKPRNFNRNIKATIFNCCNNQAGILRGLLWLMLIKSIFSDTKTLHEMATEQTEILQTVFKLF